MPPPRPPPRRRVNGRIALIGAVLALAGVAAENSLAPAPAAPPAAEPPANPSATIDGDVLTLRMPRGFFAAEVDPRSFKLSINGGPPAAPVELLNGSSDRDRVALRFAEGAGSADVATLSFGRIDAAGRVNETMIEALVRTPPGRLPSARSNAGIAQYGGVAYALGGFAPANANGASDPFDWTVFSSILRVDLATGAIRTLQARLPEPRVAAATFFDPRETPECPEGCAYAVGGLASPSDPLATILRYNPASDTLETLAARLPSPAFDLVALWTGTEAYLLGGGLPPIHRFDPLAGRVEQVALSPLTAVQYTVGVFDPRASPECPAGCGYLFGGAQPLVGAPLFVGATERDVILRFDPERLLVAPVKARLPVHVEAPSAAWDGERAIVLGGASCGFRGCVGLDGAVAFDPLRDAVTVLPRTIPERPYYGGATWHEGEVVLVGGARGSASPSPAPASEGLLGDLVRYPVPGVSS